MADAGARTYFVITVRGDRGPLDKGEVVELVRSGEIRLEDRVRNAFGRPLGTVSEITGMRASTARTTQSARPVAERTTSDRIPAERRPRPAGRTSSTDAGDDEAQAAPARPQKRGISPVLVVVLVLIGMALAGVAAAMVGGGAAPPKPTTPTTPTTPTAPTPSPATTAPLPKPDAPPIAQAPAQAQPAPVQPAPDQPGRVMLSHVITPAAASLDLSAAGSRDWVHPVDGCRKSPQANLLRIDGSGGVPVAFDGAAATCAWSDGAPIGNAKDLATGWYITGDGNGFLVSAPAGPAPAVLRLRVGSWNSAAELQATLSDNQATAITQAIPHDGNQRYVDVTITYSTVIPGQTLLVRWLQRGASGNVTLLGAALGEAVAGTAAAPVAAATPATLPAGWSANDIGGAQAAPPPAISDNGKQWRITAAGADIWGGRDQFRLLSQPLAGDGGVTARIVSCDGRHAQAKSGVMLRASLEPSAPFILLSVAPTGDAEILVRTDPGGPVAWMRSPSIGYPAWLRLKRAGALVTVWASADGRAWREIGNPQTLTSLRGPVLAGIAVCSHEEAAMTTVVSDLVVAPAR